MAGFGLCAGGVDCRGVRGDWWAGMRAAEANWGAKAAARGTFGLVRQLVGAAAECCRLGLDAKIVEA